MLEGHVFLIATVGFSMEGRLTFSSGVCVQAKPLTLREAQGMSCQLGWKRILCRLITEQSSMSPPSGSPGCLEKKHLWNHILGIFFLISRTSLTVIECFLNVNNFIYNYSVWCYHWVCNLCFSLTVQMWFTCELKFFRKHCKSINSNKTQKPKTFVTCKAIKMLSLPIWIGHRCVIDPRELTFFFLVIQPC